MPAPIVTRSWQMLSEGYHAYEQCRYVPALISPQVHTHVVDNLLCKANVEASSRPKAKCVSESAGAAKEAYADVVI